MYSGDKYHHMDQSQWPADQTQWNFFTGPFGEHYIQCVFISPNSVLQYICSEFPPGLNLPIVLQCRFMCQFTGSHIMLILLLHDSPVGNALVKSPQARNITRPLPCVNIRLNWKNGQSVTVLHKWPTTHAKLQKKKWRVPAFRMCRTYD